MPKSLFFLVKTFDLTCSREIAWSLHGVWNYEFAASRKALGEKLFFKCSFSIKLPFTIFNWKIKLFSLVFNCFTWIFPFRLSAADYGSLQSQTVWVRPSDSDPIKTFVSSWWWRFLNWISFKRLIVYHCLISGSCVVGIGELVSRIAPTSNSTNCIRLILV